MVLPHILYFVRQSLAEDPVGTGTRADKESETDQGKFWWSYVVPFFDAGRDFFDYWGHDLGDLQYLCGILKPEMVFLDIGAHHGLYSLGAVKRLGSNGTVVAFEPSVREFRRLRLRLRLNCMRSVRTEPIAIGATSCERKFFQVVSGDNTRGGLRPPATSGRVSETSVETALLDGYIGQLGFDRADFV